MMIDAALVFPLTTFGITPASATRRFPTPATPGRRVWTEVRVNGLIRHYRPARRWAGVPVSEWRVIQPEPFIWVRLL